MESTHTFLINTCIIRFQYQVPLIYIHVSWISVIWIYIQLLHFIMNSGTFLLHDSCSWQSCKEKMYHYQCYKYPDISFTGKYLQPYNIKTSIQYKFSDLVDQKKATIVCSIVTVAPYFQNRQPAKNGRHIGPKMQFLRYSSETLYVCTWLCAGCKSWKIIQNGRQAAILKNTVTNYAVFSQTTFLLATSHGNY